MKPITIEEIEYASSILFNGDKNKFYDVIEQKIGERVNVIQSLGNIDVNACPGSGKTTALLAKLIILADRMPFEDGRGICVLTHTNVAIDIIKEKLGAGASKLFIHPNFFGTIQSFVDRFLAIPFCAFDKNARIKNVDIERYTNESRKFYRGLNFGSGKVKTLKNTLYREGTRDDEWEKTSSSDKHRNAVILLSKLVFDFENERLLKNGVNGSTFRKKNSSSDRAKRDFQELMDFKNSLINEGVISFDDAYCLAFEYLSRFPEIKKAFEERFKFIFIDEMQDTASHQYKIIDELFKNEGETIVQYYGDPNQAIFEAEGQHDGGWSPKPTEPSTFTLKKSKRFGESISNVINPLRLIQNFENSIEGEGDNTNIKPYLFLFSKEETTEKVLLKFGELILKHKLNEIDDAKFVAIGRIGKEHGEGKLSIKSYFQKYEKTKSKMKEFYPKLILYLSNQSNNSNTVKNISDHIVNTILHTLDLHEFKNKITQKGSSEIVKRRFTKTSLFSFLRFNHEDVYFELKEKLIEWSNQIYAEKLPYNIEVKKQIEKFIEEKLLSIQELSINSTLDFLKIPDEVLKEVEDAKNDDSDQNQKEPNEFVYKNEKGEVIIRLNTIHGEKGETHTATLLLETYYRKKHDSEQIKQQLLGIPFNVDNDGGKEKNMAIKMAYVAKSRPKHLLCFATQKNLIQDILDTPDQRERLTKLWTIVEV